MGASNYLSRRSNVEAAQDPGRRQPARHGLATTRRIHLRGSGAARRLPDPHARRRALPGGDRAHVRLALLVGASRALVTDARFMRSGLEMLLVGSLAASVAYGIGALASSLT